MDDGEALPGAGFERGLRRAGLVLGPLIALAVYALAHGGTAPVLAALMALAVTWWITEALPAPVVALLIAAATVLFGVASPKQAFGAFGSPLLFMFVGSFFIAEAMAVHGLGERLARFTGARARTPLALLCALSATAFVLSTMMSNAAATAIVLPIALAAGRDTDRTFQAALVLSIAWGASMGGIATPVGTPPNLIGIAGLRQQGIDLGFGTWVGVGLPIGLVMLASMWAVLAAIFGVRGARVATDVTRLERAWSRGERSVVIALAIALVGWLLPSVLAVAAPGAAITVWAKARLTEETVAILAGCALFVLPGGNDERARPALTWTEAARIDWGVILLFGGGILLGDLARDSHLTESWGRALVDWTGAGSTWSIVALVTAISIVLSEATSNTATATLMVPLAAGLAEATGAAPIPAVLGATIGASFGFMMPISTAPNALAYGTGRVTMGQMMKAGIVFDVIGYVAVVAGLRLLCPLFGLA